jgi:hypothetical protein
MTKVQRDKAAVVAEINDHLSKWSDGYSALAIGAKINYYAARRALIKGLKNNSALITKLCTFFDVDPYMAKNVQITTLESLTATLRETWDGSEPHAELLHSLIKSTKPFKVQERR